MLVGGDATIDHQLHKMFIRLDARLAYLRSRNAILLKKEPHMRYETAVNKLKLDAEKRGQLKLANVEISDKEAVRYGLLTANERAICTAIADAPEDIVGKYKISVITSRKSGFLRDLKRSARRVTQKMGISDLGSSIQITAVLSGVSRSRMIPGGRTRCLCSENPFDSLSGSSSS